MAQQNLIQERRQKILDYITERSKADLAELSEAFKTTEATIRRERIELEKKKRTIRTHAEDRRTYGRKKSLSFDHAVAKPPK